MFDLGRLVSGVAQGELGIPEFQRDFDWSETDIRSLLATVFSGWPAGSLLFLEGDSGFFMLRPVEKAPELDDPTYAVLDGQQRLTALYQALHERGDMVFAVKWDIPHDQELEDCIVSYRSDEWHKSYQSFEQQIVHRIIPLSAMQSPTDFFVWRDTLLDRLDDKAKISSLRKVITDTYTHRLSAFHDYEFPVVMLDKSIEPAAVARIFEKVNRTGLTLNAFDLMVAKTFEPGWNLRDKWTTARGDQRSLGDFFGEDGMPLLQAISLLEKQDLRQAAVLGLSKQNVHDLWDEVVSAATRVADFLRATCGVVRKDWMPYPNLLSPFIALETANLLSSSPDTFISWFWYSGFAGSYDAAANTRLVSHYKNVRDGKPRGYVLDEVRSVEFASATKKNEKAMWNATACAALASIEQKAGRLPSALADELELSALFSEQEVAASPILDDPEGGPDLEVRSVLNGFLVPRRLASAIRRAGSLEALRICEESEFGAYAPAQLPIDVASRPIDWLAYAVARAQWLAGFLGTRGVTRVRITIPDEDGLMVEFTES